MKYQILYSLFYGSLIGAVVHRGFIPWDDDIDLAMFKDDFVRFKKACDTDLGKDFFFQSLGSEPKYLVPGQTKIRLNGTVLLEEADAFRDIHHGVSVDIVIFENIDDRLSNLRKTKHYFALFRDKYYYHAGRKHYSPKGMLYYTFRRILPPFSIKRTANAFLKWASKCLDNSSRFVFLPYSYQEDVYERNWLQNYRLFDFEGRQYLGFENFDKILRVRYPTYEVVPPPSAQKTNHIYSEIRLMDM